MAALGLLPAASFYLLAALPPAYLTALTPIPPSLAFTIQFVNVAALVAAMPLGGWLADALGRTPVLLGCSGAVAALSYPLWMLLALGHPAAAWAGQLLLVLLSGAFSGAVAAAEVEALPKGVRATGVALAGSAAGAVAGGLSPLIAIALVAATADKAAPAFVMIAASLASGVACWAVRQ